MLIIIMKIPFSPMASSFKITFLGTGGSWPFPGRSLPSIILQMDDYICMFDCGEGTQKQIMKSGISFMKIDSIFLTHFHGDHFLGILGLIQSMSFNGREKPLKVFGPPGAISVLSRAFNVGYFSLGFEIEINEIPFGGSVETGFFRIDTLKADHPVPAVSYKVTENDMVKIDPEKAKLLGIPSEKLEKIRKNGSINLDGRIITLNEISGGIKKGRSMVYSGDTRPNPNMPEFAKGVDVLIHDTTTDSSLEPKVNEFGHSSSRQAAEIARSAEVKSFYLFHYSPRVDNPEILLDEAKKIFSNSILSRELLSVEIKKGETIPENQ
ncbi:MAG: ribonuclease Z [Cuniculiplasma sp.]